MSKLCCTYIIGKFAMGLDELREMQGYLRAKVDGKTSPYDRLYCHGFTETLFETQLHHAYHYFNYVWGCRHATHERATRCAGHPFHSWEKFPLAFKELLPEVPRRAIQVHPETVLYYESILLGLEEALRVGEEIYLGLSTRLTESRLKELLCRLLGALNFAWNVRRFPIERVRALSPRAKQRCRQYPAEFAYYLTARHYTAKGAV